MENIENIFSNKELIEKIKELCKKEILLDELCDLLELNQYEVLGLINHIKSTGTNIAIKIKDDGYHVYNEGEISNSKENNFRIEPDENNQLRCLVISDTMLGSKYQQLSILNDLYEKAHKMGINTVLHCGNISAGLYKVSNKYAHTLFKDDTMQQANYIAEKYPKIEGMTTYFIGGVKDETHFKLNKLYLGKRINELRSDLVYLGDNMCNINLGKANILLMNISLNKTYTASYRIQQMIDSFRSEDKPDVLLYGGLLQDEQLTRRDVKAYTIPSVVATTEEMTQKRYSNTIGAWFIDFKLNEKGQLENVIGTNCTYYVTSKDDYEKAKVLKIDKRGK